MENMKRRKQNHKISFHFFAAPPAPPPFKWIGKEIFGFVRDWKEREAGTVRTTMKSERMIWFKATTHSARCNHSELRSKKVRAKVTISPQIETSCSERTEDDRAEGAGEEERGKRRFRVATN